MKNRLRLALLAAAIFVLSAAFAAATETEGYASWYGPHFQGKLTASGEIFDTNRFTAAHKSLPFGSIVKVTNLENNRSVVVRINDRGPYVAGRIIDLTHAAAGALGMLGDGVAKVRLDVLHQQQENAMRTIQVAAFDLRINALKVQKQLYDLGLEPAIESSATGIYRVLLTGIPLADVSTMQQKLRQIGYPETLVRMF
ncbi:MAG TPA: septal ring lytic transglycosylase RlpA family protein [Spirochaetia bacterium]|nr:septal ring lytic transglycosylase RlpA family protein [Spirochaetia bacterium]